MGGEPSYEAVLTRTGLLAGPFRKRNPGRAVAPHWFGNLYLLGYCVIAPIDQQSATFMFDTMMTAAPNETHPAVDVGASPFAPTGIRLNDTTCSGGATNTLNA